MTLGQGDDEMAKYVFAYHGGGMPETEAEQAAVMAAWESWMGNNASSIVDGGNPCGQAKTVGAGGSVTDGGGANPVSGYGLFTAVSIDDAVELAKGCPILDSGGTVEVAEAIDM